MYDAGRCNVQVAGTKKRGRVDVKGTSQGGGGMALNDDEPRLQAAASASA